MRTISTVTTARTDGGLLVSLDEIKAELKITTTETDDYYSAVALRFSQLVEKHCNRVFASERISQAFYPSQSGRLHAEMLILSRRPVIGSIVSVTSDDVAIASSEYNVDAAVGLLYRLDASGYPDVWSASKSIVVVFDGGYAATPGPVQQALFELVKMAQAARTRDPLLRSENILEGLYSYQLFVPTDMVNGLPANVAAMLDLYRNSALA